METTLYRRFEVQDSRWNSRFSFPTLAETADYGRNTFTPCHHCLPEQAALKCKEDVHPVSVGRGEHCLRHRHVPRVHSLDRGTML
jgi:hypothetical protein